jgi:hypothetical protein
MLGRWVRASQTYGPFPVIRCGGATSSASFFVETIFIFYDLRTVPPGFEGVKQWLWSPSLSYGSFALNIRMLSCPSGACYQ